ncbi:MAG: hypothetical protein D6798_14640 [Deltaproteobacteria bacterium]|nr:MAG: hypothetical protein D6798_14640 [Deltaproteobacteria bacterium]
MPIGTLGRGPLPVTTASSGVLAAYALSPQARIEPDVTWGAMTGLGYGAVIGGGIGMLIDPPGDIVDAPPPDGGAVPDEVQAVRISPRQAHEEAPERISITLGGGLGLVAGGALAYRAPGGLRFDDAMLVGLTTGWATWQTAGWSAVTDIDRRYQGALVLTPAAIGAATAAATPLIAVDFGDSLAATSLGLWGAYLGGAAGVLADADGDETMRLALGFSDVGLVTGAVLMSPVVDASPTVVGVADAGGVLGGSTAALVTALFTDDSDSIVIASLAGAGAGAVGGAWIGRGLERRSVALHLNLPRMPGLPPGLQLAPAYYATAAGGCWGARADLTGW